MEKERKEAGNASDQAEVLRRKLSRRDTLRLGASVGIAGALGGGTARCADIPVALAATATITAAGQQWGVSTARIGVTEGMTTCSTLC